ncbi:uncharacterized protein N7443_001005 [Penicillium atrosanguineum]|uniref:uncharacterized protein n=1 Tax=Penicillium atrosanguineum TaxID=1132637 RepID=UPI002386A877|nr:uncharacterized protein N7443_001005 [Penicillium atrosanguineum]KAJ5314121.1 hypothetical protein N7443_001005 [Penicillium atrosanguineum]
MCYLYSCRKCPKPEGTDDIESENECGSTEQQLGRLVIDDTRSCYVSNIMWASLSDEIEGLRDLLHESSSEAEEENDNESAFTDNSGPYYSPNASIMGFQTLAPSLGPYHPTMSNSVALLEIFKESVVPFVHIFHMPTLMEAYWDAMASPEMIDRNTEALLFAIYYSTVISMESSQCEKVLGLSRSNAVKHFQFATQQAMARADLLNTQSLVLLQAVVLFLSALRNEDASRSAWSLTALIYHIARAMGLHRDGSNFGLRPLEIELRRRLWWHICLLDIRSSEYHGCEPIVQYSMFDTKPPLNINDSDLTVNMNEPPAEHEGATEMTFCLIRCEVLRALRKTTYLSPKIPFAGRTAHELSLPDRIKVVKDLEEHLETRYLKHCDITNPLFRLCVTVTRLIVARSWLFVYYPLIQKNDGTRLPTAVRDQFFQTSVRVLEQSHILLTSPENAKWVWHSKTHIQWHAVAIVLSEICSSPPSTEIDRAWEYVQTICDRWKLKEHKGNLWRPIKRLMAKAEYVRERQRMQDPSSRMWWRVAGGTSMSTGVSSLGLADSADLGSNDKNSILSVETLDSIIGLSPELGSLDSTLGYTAPADSDFTMMNWAGGTEELDFGTDAYGLQ